MNHSPVTIHQVQEAENLFFEDFLKRCFQKWYWFLATLLISVGVGYFYFINQQPVYQIFAKLAIKDKQKGADENNTFQEIQPSSSKKIVDNEIEVLHSFLLMKRVVENLNLTVHYYEPKGFANWEIFEKLPFSIKVINPTPLLYTEPIEVSLPTLHKIRIDGLEYPMGKEIQTPFGTILVSSKKSLLSENRPLKLQFIPVEEQTLQLLKALKIESASKSSSVIHLTIEDVLPTRGEAILTQLLKEYGKASALDKKEVVVSTLQFIDQRIKGLSAEVVRVEKQVESFKTINKITDLSNQADYVLKNVQANDAKINEVTIQLATLSDLEKYINAQTEKLDMAPATLGIQDKILISLIERLTKLEQERAELEKLTSAQNFLVQNLTNQIKTHRLNIRDNIKTMRAMLISSKKEIQIQNALLEAQIRTIPQQERQLIDITRQQAIKNELFTYMLKKREEAAVLLGASLSDSRIIDPPHSTFHPIKPVRSLTFGFFILFGLVFPALVIAGQKFLNNRVNQRKDVEAQTRVPILGEIILYPSTKPLVVTSVDHTIISEQIRGLRANLQLMQRKDFQSLVLLTTSSISGEGKTFLSQNIGASLALANFPTVLVEMDLRNPRLHKAFGPPNKLGISDYLRGECELDEIIHAIPGYEQLYLVSSGSTTSSPAELLCSPRLGKLLSSLKQRFAFVLMDTPPIGIISDAQVLAPYADVTLFVIRHDITPKNCLKIINCLSEEKRFPQPMIILNAVPEKASYHLNYSYKYTY